MDVNNSEDILDSRDIIARIEELRQRVEATEPNFNPEEVVELAILTNLVEQVSGSAEGWPYETTLIRDSYFTEYAKLKAGDEGWLTPDMNSWPYNHINWTAAADELQEDYTAVDFDGFTYWVR